MISIGKVNGGGASYYAADNYYTAGEGTEQSAWFGKGAERLGLEGRVDPAVFDQILHGKLPDGTEIATPRGKHREGRDLAFSVSKSVSLVALVGGDQRIVTELKEAVATTLGWIEANLMEARVLRGAQQETVQTDNMLAALFLHDVSREQEPQLHIHAVVANVTQRADGKWRATENDALYKHQLAARTVFNAELRSRIEALGYQTVAHEKAGYGAFEIAGVSREMVKAFSTRSQKIHEVLKEQGRGSPREREIVALATRRGKDSAADLQQRGKGWGELADRLGLDAKSLVAQALGTRERGETMWSRFLDGVRDVGARGRALAAAMGLTPRDGDALVPERLGRLQPQDYAAAQAVASAARDLSEREAGFHRFKLIERALDRMGPVKVADVEKRIDLLAGKGLLLGGRENMLTPRASLQLEQAILAHLKAAIGAGVPLMNRPEAAARVQEAAREMGLRRLNPGQQGAAVDILSSSNRVHYVQGGAGVGKSAALGPVAAVARQLGHQVHALAIAKGTALDFGRKVGAPGQTIASFLMHHKRVLDGTASPAQLSAARAQIAGSIIMVDEASMVPNQAFEQILRLGNMLGAANVIMAGDVRQLLAIEAGKPFGMTQEQGAPTSHIRDNLRAASPLAKAVNAALEREDIAAAFDALKANTVEVTRDEAPAHAADRWWSSPKAQRENTVLLALSRSMRSATNAAVQQRLREAGELGPQSRQLAVLDRVTVTREGARQMRAYQEGRIVEFNTSLAVQGFARGERGAVIDRTESAVMLRMTDGTVKTLQPDCLPQNVEHDAVTIYQEKPLTIHEGDRLRWTANDPDKERGLVNGQLAQVRAVGADSLTVRTAEGVLHTLMAGDPMLEKVDLAYALTVHAAQGLTAQGAILVMSEQERQLNSARSFLVAATRVSDDIMLVVDDAKGLERSVLRNDGGKTSAIEIVGEGRRPGESEAQMIARKLGFELGGSAKQPEPEAEIDLPERSIERSR